MAGVVYQDISDLSTNNLEIRLSFELQCSSTTHFEGLGSVQLILLGGANIIKEANGSLSGDAAMQTLSRAPTSGRPRSEGLVTVTKLTTRKCSRIQGF